MKDWNREAVARHMFEIMNRDRFENSCYSTQQAWDFYVKMGWYVGYLRIADAVIVKGYKP